MFKRDNFVIVMIKYVYLIAFMVKSKLKLAVFFSSENQKSGAVIR